VPIAYLLQKASTDGALKPSHIHAGQHPEDQLSKAERQSIVDKQIEKGISLKLRTN